ncbi:UDP-N-acetylglucosamine 2-epimerase [soil metagenome]
MRRIAVLTGTRADYGLLKPLIGVLEKDDRVQVQLIVSGSHLSEAHGDTVQEIVADGHSIAARIPVWSGDDSSLGAATDTGAALGAYASVLDSLRPDIVVLLGDRLEALAMALAATVLGVPVAHIHGGELTEGAMDDALRHAITKLAHLHFTTTDEHRARVLQLGEQPDRVYNLGAPVLDAIETLEFLDAEQIRERFGATVDRSTVLLTFHPAAFDPVPSSELLWMLLGALDEAEGIRLIVTGTNSDIGSDSVREQLIRFVEQRDWVDYVESFGQLAYLSTMRLAGLVVGNSSSTVLEAPLLGIPSVLVGDRQHGRPVSASVLTPEPQKAAIAAAIERGLSSEFRESSTADGSVFGAPGFAARAAEILATAQLDIPPRKTFSDQSRTT